jgi:hypothetical protein
MPRSKNEWSYISLPYAPSWRGARLKKAQVQRRGNYFVQYVCFSNGGEGRIHKIPAGTFAEVSGIQLFFR